MGFAGLEVTIQYLKPILQEKKGPVHRAAGRPQPERALNEHSRDLGPRRKEQATFLLLASAPHPSHP